MKFKKLFSFLLLFLTSLSLLSACSKHVKVLQHDYFEKPQYSFQLNNKEKENINSFLENYYVETTNVAGFSKYESIYDLTSIKNCLDLSINCKDTSSYNSLYNMVYNKLKTFNISQIENCNDLYYYFSIMGKYELPIGENFYNLLNSYFDEESSLFFYNGKNDSEQIKLATTINFYSALKDDPIFIAKYRDSVKTKISHIYNNFNFLSPNSNSSFYNSGGRIIIAANLILDKKDFSDKQEWYDQWKQSAINVNDSLSALLHCDFLDIMSIFEEIDNSQLDNYLSQIHTVNLDSDLEYLSRVSNYLDITKYDFYQNLKLNEYISNLKLVKQNIDIENTYYGYLLSSATNYPIDNTKLNNLIPIYYEMISNEESIDKLSHFIYFTVGLDICINNTISGDLNMLSQKINYVLEHEARSIEFRKMIETLSAISLYKPITISSSHTNKISKQVNEVFNDESNLSTVLIADLLIMDYNINGTLNKEILNKSKDILYSNGGFKDTYTDSDANILSTYALYKLNTITDDHKYISNNISFVDSLKIAEGIYSYSLNDSTVSLITIWYGNIISKSQLHLLT